MADRRSQNAKITSFTDLKCWQVAHKLRIDVLLTIKDFPEDYRFGLSSQIQRSAVSVGSNIAEGFGRKTVKEKVRLYDIARGSLTELQDQLLTARDIDILDRNKFDQLAEDSVRVHKLINGLIRSIRSTNPEIRNTNYE